MPNYNEYDNNSMIRQKDLVLAPNEFCYVQNKTNGIVKTHAGPTTVTVSQQETLVIFDSKTKQFKEIQNPDHAKQLFVSAPENWYIVLKNPAQDNDHPVLGKESFCDNLRIGEKINVRGPVTFALYPGQMTKIVRGHSLRSNQYLLARVYEANAASTHQGEILDAEGKQIEQADTTYVNGQILVIKGTEVSFYIPPTGIEVIPVNNDPACGYVRDAVTLERLEYCILKDEDGNKRYVHGPEVVFPEPTETFVMSPKKSYIFRAIELSKISGIYVKVIAEYEDDGVVHPIGEELFITGNDQMIYYPRPEHAIINYDDKITHHAIAIPEGEGRYIMDRLTGEIKTVKGPAMYLPDPRTEVVVKRKLTPSQCHLWYPGNEEVLKHNEALTEKAVEKSLKMNSKVDDITSFLCAYNSDSTLANLEAKANISRGTSYTKPRTITLDNRYDGVVTLDVWTGYAVNVISKNGNRKVVCGPQTVMLDYDQTLEVLEMSTGRPKTTDRLIKTVFLRHENNKVSDLINIETKDYVKAEIKVSYCVNFDKKQMDKWFSIENYVKYLTDHERSLIKRAAKQYTIEEFYQNYADIVRDIAINKPAPKTENDSNPHRGREFTENGMCVYDIEVLSIKIEPEVEELLLDHQYEMVKKSLELSTAEEELKITRALGAAEEEKQKLRTQKVINKLELDALEYERQIELKAAANRKKEAEEKAARKAQEDLLPIIDVLHQAELARKKAVADQELEIQKAKNDNALAFDNARAEIEKAKQQAYANSVKDILGSISTDVANALAATGHTDLVNVIAKSISPYAIANGESVADAVNKLLRGTPIEGLVDSVSIKTND